MDSQINWVIKENFPEVLPMNILKIPSYTNHKMDFATRLQIYLCMHMYIDKLLTIGSGGYVGFPYMWRWVWLL